ncbi:hypothetical protein H8R18_01355 [Nanchangia anserum]|uniref:Uncharacterized protein n=1 Tax=Nanchangia anserum TaxID=2692125 RepID=A0A8I0G8L1_9ACTO|nr:hypothetical protein [Nanchangia anserum]MBD3689882.1 hypothetical protein [Nanchangia anserum]QOX82052.1 hypothetical protein H8R18_01355 [Nanchangia anserum]
MTDLIPLPAGATTLAHVIAGLRDDIRKTTPRRLGQSTITTGTLEVKDGAAIRVAAGGRLVVEDGGTIQTDAAAIAPTNIGIAPQLQAATGEAAGIGADWTRLAGVKFSAPAWANRAIIHATGSFTFAAPMGDGGDVRGRIKTTDTPGVDSYGTWNRYATSGTWTGETLTETHNVHAPLAVDVEGLATLPAELAGTVKATITATVWWLI